jgi:predicted DNA-binding protein
MFMVKRVNVNFSDEVYRELTELAKQQGKTLSDVLRDALTLEKYVTEAQWSGGRLLV